MKEHLDRPNETQKRLADDLVRVSRVYCQRKRTSLSGVAREATNNARLFNTIYKRGCSLNIYGVAMQFLSDNWPDLEGIPWPDGVWRPSPIRAAPKRPRRAPNKPHPTTNAASQPEGGKHVEGHGISLERREDPADGRDG